jgi:hypothetical protein
MQRCCADVISPYKPKCWTNSGGPLVNSVLWGRGVGSLISNDCRKSLALCLLCGSKNKCPLQIHHIGSVCLWTSKRTYCYTKIALLKLRKRHIHMLKHQLIVAIMCNMWTCENCALSSLKCVHSNCLYRDLHDNDHNVHFFKFFRIN